MTILHLIIYAVIAVIAVVVICAAIMASKSERLYEQHERDNDAEKN